MTVASDVNKHIYTGNGVTRVWSYSFLLFDASHMQVWVKRGEADSVRLERGFVLNEQARTVTYPVDGTGEAPLSSQDKIILRRELPIIQDTDLENQGAFLAETHEQTFDKIVMMIQQLSEQLLRGCLGPIESAGPINLIIHTLEANKSSYGQWEADTRTLHFYLAPGYFAFGGGSGGSTGSGSGGSGGGTGEIPPWYSDIEDAIGDMEDSVAAAEARIDALLNQIETTNIAVQEKINSESQ
ncbi:MAG: hypothetical protein Q4C86_10930, partial [bacterium]|nr:hypothetical protein [bacterium]